MDGETATRERAIHGVCLCRNVAGEIGRVLPYPENLRAYVLNVLHDTPYTADILSGKGWIKLPVTAVVLQLTIPGMTTVGRRVGTPTEYRDAIIERTKKAREKTGLNQVEMAERLSAECQRPISADTYRQWEKETTLPLDVIMPLCNLAHVHPWEFLAPVPFPNAASAPTRSRKSAAA